jgi:hypothetical protein
MDKSMAYRATLFLTHRTRPAMIPASGDIAMAWPNAGGPVLVCAYTQGGSPTSKQFEAVFAEIGRMVGKQLG